MLKPFDRLAEHLPLKRNQLIAVAAALVVVLAVGLGVGLSGGGKPVAAIKGHNGTSSPPSGTRTTTTASTIPSFGPGICPLTDTPAAGGRAPLRPALAVKIGTEPGSDPAAGAGARPQSGLDEADIVYDTPTEGFLMRYMAVYQCQDASSIGPIRSVRWVDWHILRQFVHPILAFAGGILPDQHDVYSSKWILPANVIGQQAEVATQLAGRSAPDATYSSTTALYGLYPKQTTPPKPVFEYTAALPSTAKPAASLALDFSFGTDVLWRWDAATGLWDHYYFDGTNPATATADTDALSNAIVSTTNIVVQVVKYKFGPYPESPGSTGDFESNTVGEGPGMILRDGKSIDVTWHRKNLLSPMTFTDAGGQTVGLAPGRTWVELVPNTTFTSAGRVVLTK